MEGIRAGIKADRPVAMMEFLKNFYSADGTDGKLVSERVMQANWTVVIGAAPIATLACVDAWIEDFRNDIPRNDVPTMSIHGDDDRILPFDATSRRQAKMIKGVKYVDIKGGSHGITWTRADETRTREFPRLASWPNVGDRRVAPSADVHSPAPVPRTRMSAERGERNGN